MTASQKIRAGVKREKTSGDWRRHEQCAVDFPGREVYFRFGLGIDLTKPRPGLIPQTVQTG